MSQHLPNFEGRTVRSAALSVTGTITDEANQPADPLDIDDQIIIIATGTVKGIKHSSKDGIVTRTRIIGIEETFPLVGPMTIEEVHDILTDARRWNMVQTEKLREQQTGQTSIKIEYPDPIPGQQTIEAGSRFYDELPPGEPTADDDVVDAEIVDDNADDAPDEDEPGE